MSKIAPLVNDAFALAVAISDGLNIVLPKSRRAHLAYLRAADQLAKQLADAGDMAGQAALRGLQAGLESRSPKAGAKAEEALTDSLGRLADCIDLVRFEGWQSATPSCCAFFRNSTHCTATAQRER